MLCRDFLFVERNTGKIVHEEGRDRTAIVADEYLYESEEQCRRVLGDKCVLRYSADAQYANGFCPMTNVYGPKSPTHLSDLGEEASFYFYDPKDKGPRKWLYISKSYCEKASGRKCDLYRIASSWLFSFIIQSEEKQSHPFDVPVYHAL
jgi:hypothetical protein